jgi:hypothetical protein
MRFGFRREKPKASAEQTIAKEDMDAETLRRAINSAKVARISAQEIANAYAVQHELNESDTSIPEGTKQVGILILPESQNVMDFWTLYQSVQQSGVPNHVGVFTKTNGAWLEEKLSE